jgi:hypothetical protein
VIKPQLTELSQAVAEATRSAVRRLFECHPGKYYYISLAVFQGVAPPVLSAWSWEALDAATKDDPSAREFLKWSYADSPFYAFGANEFRLVEDLVAARPNIYELSEANAEAEATFRLAEYEKAIASLDADGVFGVGEARRDVAVLVEVMPPDATNLERAIRLNPPAAIAQWLAEAAK